MKICEDRHEAVAYEDYDYRLRKTNPCPVCEVLDREAALEEENEELKARIEILEEITDDARD